MKLIAHRGLIDGPNPVMENDPNHIRFVLSLGFDAEIDVWLINGEWWLGHDGPTHPVNAAFLMLPGLWIHCKNLDAMHRLTSFKCNFFWHDTDDFTLTRFGYIWTYPGKTLTDASVCVQPEWDDNWRDLVKDMNCFGICSKYVADIKLLRKA